MTSRLLSRVLPGVRTAARHVKTTGAKPLGAQADFTVRHLRSPHRTAVVVFYILFRCLFIKSDDV